MTARFNDDYAERVYAGVLGKVIGVYLGRPSEGWTFEMIQERLGDIDRYVHEELGVPLIVTDDDISGTFTFVRSLEDHDYDPGLTAEKIGDSWLNYLIENRTILWWGGLGNSTEHTAYLRLKSGIHAPADQDAEQRKLLATCPFTWQLGRTYELSIHMASDRIEGSVDGERLISVNDRDLEDGACALLVEAGRTATGKVAVIGNQD